MLISKQENNNNIMVIKLGKTVKHWWSNHWGWYSWL